jgi:hypothetical protein
MFQTCGSWVLKDLESVEVSRGKGSQSSFLTQLYILTRRSFLNMTRDWSYYWVRLIMYIALAIFIGYVYGNETFDYQSINVGPFCESELYFRTCNPFCSVSFLLYLVIIGYS